MIRRSTSQLEFGWGHISFFSEGGPVVNHLYKVVHSVTGQIPRLCVCSCVCVYDCVWVCVCVWELWQLGAFPHMNHVFFSRSRPCLGQLHRLKRADLGLARAHGGLFRYLCPPHVAATVLWERGLFLLLLPSPQNTWQMTGVSGWFCQALWSTDEPGWPMVFGPSVRERGFVAVILMPYKATCWLLWHYDTVKLWQ